LSRAHSHDPWYNVIMRICVVCDEEFLLTPDKPGKINECARCATPGPPKVGGNMVWSHKTAPELEIKSMAEARRFAAQTRRFGAGVTACLTTKREDSGKDGSGAEPGAAYVSNLGEKRSVKL
jgi:hypothetical protein